MRAVSTPTSTPCPIWCQADHAAQTHQFDAGHWGEVASVTATQLRVHRPGFVRDSDERALQLDIGLEQRAQEDETYISLVVDEADDRSLLITPESALRLSRALASAVATCKKEALG